MNILKYLDKYLEKLIPETNVTIALIVGARSNFSKIFKELFLLTTIQDLWSSKRQKILSGSVKTILPNMPS